MGDGGNDSAASSALGRGIASWDDEDSEGFSGISLGGTAVGGFSFAGSVSGRLSCGLEAVSSCGAAALLLLRCGGGSCAVP